MIFCYSGFILAVNLADLEEKLQPLIADVNYPLGIYVLDLKTGYSWGYRQDEPFRPASLIKATLISPLTGRLQTGDLDLKEQLTIKKELYTYSSILKKSLLGWKVQMRKLLYPCFCLSDNLAANLLANYFGLETINKDLQLAGYETTRFNRLFVDKRMNGQETNKITPAEAGKLFRNLYNEVVNHNHHALLFLNLLKRNIYTWGIVRGTPRQIKVAHMVGINDKVVNDAGIVLCRKNPYVLVVLSNHYQDKQAAQQKIAEIARITHQHFCNI